MPLLGSHSSHLFSLSLFCSYFMVSLRADMRLFDASDYSKEHWYLGMNLEKGLSGNA